MSSEQIHPIRVNALREIVGLFEEETDVLALPASELAKRAELAGRARLELEQLERLAETEPPAVPRRSAVPSLSRLAELRESGRALLAAVVCGESDKAMGRIRELAETLRESEPFAAAFEVRARVQWDLMDWPRLGQVARRFVEGLELLELAAKSEPTGAQKAGRHEQSPDEDFERQMRAWLLEQAHKLEAALVGKNQSAVKVHQSVIEVSRDYACMPEALREMLVEFRANAQTVPGFDIDCSSCVGDMERATQTLIDRLECATKSEPTGAPKAERRG